MFQVQERIEDMGLGTLGQGMPHASPRPSMDPYDWLSSQTTTHTCPHAPAIHEPKPNRPHPHLQPGDLWEILCNDIVLPPKIMLAVVWQYVWRQSGKVVLYYCRKRPAAAIHGKD
jgi:hypothetical protein